MVNRLVCCTVKRGQKTQSDLVAAGKYASASFPWKNGKTLPQNRRPTFSISNQKSPTLHLQFNPGFYTAVRLSCLKLQTGNNRSRNKRLLLSHPFISLRQITTDHVSRRFPNQCRATCFLTKEENDNLRNSSDISSGSRLPAECCLCSRHLSEGKPEQVRSTPTVDRMRVPEHNTRLNTHTHTCCMLSVDLFAIVNFYSTACRLADVKYTPVP